MKVVSARISQLPGVALCIRTIKQTAGCPAWALNLALPTGLQARIGPMSPRSLHCLQKPVRLCCAAARPWVVVGGADMPRRGPSPVPAAAAPPDQHPTGLLHGVRVMRQRGSGTRLSSGCGDPFVPATAGAWRNDASGAAADVPHAVRPGGRLQTVAATGEGAAGALHCNARMLHAVLCPLPRVCVWGWGGGRGGC